jgi:hypothetical protein
MSEAFVARVCVDEQDESPPERYTIPGRMYRAGAVAIIIGVTIAGTSAQNDVLATLGTNLREAQTSIFASFATGAAALSGDRSVFKAATPEQRAAMTRAVVGIARTFASSREFSDRYALYRETQKPRRSSSARTGDEARAFQQQAIELAVKQALAAAEQLTPQARKELEASIAAMRQQVAELNADPGYRAQVDEATAAAAREEDAELAKQLALFNADFPEDVDALIARRLRQFLLACSDIDFAATLEPAPGGRMRFANAAYERRSAEWKMCFRAGRPAVQTARAAAEDWLNALTHKGF